MKKIYLIISIIIILLVAVFVVVFFINNKACKIFGNSNYVNNLKISASTPNKLEQIQKNFDKVTNKIKITKPLPNEEASSPMEITGEALGTWFFEATFPIELKDKNGQVISTGIARAESDWMTEKFVPFKANLNFVVSTNTESTLILKKDNPSGLPEKDEKIEIPLILKAGVASSTNEINGSSTMTVRIFFGNSKFNSETLDCSKTFSVDRVITKTEVVGQAALSELLKGPTENEKQSGYFSSINSNVKINSLKIINGVAKVDFDKQLENAAGGSCRVSAIRAQISDTLKQFSSVKDVIISIAGRTEDILQP
jgi:spore germination protein GerM